MAMVFLLVACGPADGNGDADKETDRIVPDAAVESDDTATDSLDEQVGFVTLEPRSIRIEGDVVYEGLTTQTRLFYVFTPATTAARRMPLLVVFNGGPSVATSGNLAAFGMGKHWIDYYGDGGIHENPANFAEIGNLLFIDTRHVGFSYGILDTPESERARSDAYNFINFGIYTAAADILLVVLDLLGRVPEIAHNPVVFVGESFGGARAAMIAALLMRPSALMGDGPLVDPTLGAALRTHFNALSPGVPFDALTVNDTKRQFGWHVLLQPGYMLAPVDAYFHTTCLHLDASDPRNPLCVENPVELDLRHPGGVNGVLMAGHDAVLTPDGFERLFGVPPQSVVGLAAKDRLGAFRYASITDSTLFELWYSLMGTLASYDTYYLPRLDTGLDAVGFSVATTATVPFMESLAHLHVFISNAFYDGIIAADRIPGGLMQASRDMASPLIASARLENEVREGATRPGWLDIEFTDAMGLGSDNKRTVRMPFYEDSGHMITLTQAGALRDDIQQFLASRGAYR